jgi:hypothetical protein
MKLSTVLLGTCLANYNPYTIPSENVSLEWVDSNNFMEFIANEGDKPFVKYQAPDDEYVPIQQLPIVFLNGIKFHRQGKQPRPGTLERFQKLTRTTNGKLICEDSEQAKEERQTHRTRSRNKEEKPEGRSHGVDLAAAMFATNYPRYNGRGAPLPYDELQKLDLDFSDLNPTNDQEAQIQSSPNLDFANLDPLQGGMQSDVFIEPQDDDTVIMNLASSISDDIDMEPQTEEEMALDREALRLKRLKNQFYQQEKVKIGCCNGVPYNSKKRCCCRRVSFDKDKKFCCAINGCESFQIFDRDNAKHYKDCLSLSGLVIQEYGYQGQTGQPKMGWTQARPRRLPGQ